MTTKHTAQTARANLFVTRGKMATAQTSAQSRAFRDRKLAKDAREAEARKLNAQRASGAAAEKTHDAPAAPDAAQTTTSKE